MSAHRIDIPGWGYVEWDTNYDSAFTDISEWSCRVRRGGIVAGDDYDAPGVKQAAHTIARGARVTEWWLTDDPNRRNKKGQRMTSWWWVNP